MINSCGTGKPTGERTEAAAAEAAAAVRAIRAVRAVRAVGGSTPPHGQRRAEANPPPQQKQPQS